ncbi:unnamed protein product [Prunus armeniaca]
MFSQLTGQATRTKKRQRKEEGIIFSFSTFSIVSSNTKRSLSFAEPYEWSLNSLDRSKLEAKGVSEKLFFIKKVILGWV